MSIATATAIITDAFDATDAAITLDAITTDTTEAPNTSAPPSRSKFEAVAEDAPSGYRFKGFSPLGTPLFEAAPSLSPAESWPKGVARKRRREGGEPALKRDHHKNPVSVSRDDSFDLSEFKAVSDCAWSRPVAAAKNSKRDVTRHVIVAAMQELMTRGVELRAWLVRGICSAMMRPKDLSIRLRDDEAKRLLALCGAIDEEGHGLDPTEWSDGFASVIMREVVVTNRDMSAGVKEDLSSADPNVCSRHVDEVWSAGKWFASAEREVPAWARGRARFIVGVFLSMNENTQMQLAKRLAALSMENKELWAVRKARHKKSASTMFTIEQMAEHLRLTTHQVRELVNTHGAPSERGANNRWYMDPEAFGSWFKAFLQRGNAFGANQRVKALGYLRQHPGATAEQVSNELNISLEICQAVAASIEKADKRASVDQRKTAVLEILKESPEMPNKEVADKAGVNPSYVKNTRTHFGIPVGQHRGGPTPKQPTARKQPSTPKQPTAKQSSTRKRASASPTE